MVKSKSVKKKPTKQKRARRIHKKHAGILGALLMTITAIIAFTWLLNLVTDKQSSQLGRFVTFYDRGQEQVILTQAKTVRDALKSAEISVTKQDVVEPDINSKLESSDNAVIIYRARPVLVVDGEIRQKVVTAAAAPRQLVKLAGLEKLSNSDKTTFTTGSFVEEGVSTILTIKRKAIKPKAVVFKPKPNALTKQRGAHIYVDSDGVAHRETYYDLPMNIVINHCGKNNKYTIRAVDGAKVDKDGYILVAANYNIYPRCSIVDTSMGPGKVYDTGGFALRYPHGFDLATDWSYPDGI